MEANPEEAISEAPPQELPARERNPGGLFYECINCGSRLTADQLAMTPEIKCPFCGYRILRKVRPPIVKHVKAR
jgi:DNA-directed RNA polymerase subunit P